ncbi:hypothetical protein [Algisphaera agarilytica]|uniref:Uncharacterized protein n=1 Tax=Algisphaera agarilytica TaxID=1385975 RepID=A0A7X0LM41_9BACT|nr:hypothetical protein [Algisphaera agarilytica]MBB6431564.1 hypothetical protein [Algisphaera agarilytica]
MKTAESTRPTLNTTTVPSRTGSVHNRHNRQAEHLLSVAGPRNKKANPAGRKGSEKWRSKQEWQIDASDPFNTQQIELSNSIYDAGYGTVKKFPHGIQENHKQAPLL